MFPLPPASTANMATPSTLNTKAPIFVPAYLAPAADPTTTSALLDYFYSLRASKRSIHPGGRSASSPAPVPYQSNHRAARAAMIEFACYYGEDADNLAAWQALLSTCSFNTIPVTLKECKDLFHTIQVNVFDLVEASRLGLKTKSFLYARDLAVYSKAMGRICPVNIAKEGTLFKALLRRFE